MYKPLLLITLFASSMLAFSQANIESTYDALETRFMDAKTGYDRTYQEELRQQPEWQGFLQQNGTWYVHYNEHNQLPHRAYGRPIAVVSDSPQQMAIDFMSSHLGGFELPTELAFQSEVKSDQYTWANFKQQYQGLDILGSRYSVKFKQNKVVLFACDLHPTIALNTTPSMDWSAATSIASNGITTPILAVETGAQPAILPIPNGHQYTYHLVYEITVKTMDVHHVPSHYYTLVDAHTGEILYRKNLVAHHDHSHCGHPKAPAMSAVSVNVTGGVYQNNIYDAETQIGLPNIYVTVAGTDYQLDESGSGVIPVNPGSSAQIRLMGPWSRVYTNNVTPTLTATLQDGENAVVYNASSNIKERSAYKSVNEIHDHMKFWMPDFDGMDFQLPTNVDLTSGDCNAFYDGSSINFYALANGCNATATVADVVYHEYGHGINDNYYQSQGTFFQNGAMGEGYADFWAISLSNNPVLGSGFYTTNQDPIRDYTEAPKVYPNDIVGEVHADGEIIMGAWWDTHLLMGSNWDLTMDLFVNAYAGLQAATFDGNEGEAYTDVLIDVLQADDNDGDITNGTPNGNAIAEGFYIHGITLISNSQLSHESTDFIASNTDLDIFAGLDITFPFTQYLEQVQIHHRINNGPWNTTTMTEDSVNDYSFLIEGQPAGTVIQYYVTSSDINGSMAGALPIKSALNPFPNLPFITLVGVQLEKTHDGDDNNEFGSWQKGLPTDNATTGEWDQDVPIGSYTTDASPGTMVAVDENHTPGGEICFFTGNASSASAAIGENDVDGGKTTLQSPVMDLTSYTQPIIEYYRYYTNNPPGGANPGQDYWQVRVTNDNGVSWTYIENLKTSDASWRRNAFRVNDYIEPTASMRFQFIASDSTIVGQNLDGGSLIEAAMDDFKLYDEFIVGVEELETSNVSVYPSPASYQFTISSPQAADVTTILVVDAQGRKVWSTEQPQRLVSGQSWTVDASRWAAGTYTVHLYTAAGILNEKVIVTKP